MDFKQYTKCIDPSEFNPNDRYWVPASRATAMLIFGGAFVAASQQWWCSLIVVEMAFLAGVIGSCDYFHYYRLICLGGDSSLKGDKDCCGAIVGISAPKEDLFDFDWDTDYGIDVLLEDNAFGSNKDAVELSLPYGHLIAPHDSLNAVGVKTLGREAKDEATGTTSAVLHVEFEGGGMNTLRLGAMAALGLAFAALLACTFVPGPWGAIVAAILGFLALLVIILAGLIGNYTTGSPPDDVAGDLKENDDLNNGLGAGATVVYVRGSWVYDSVHQGWNEIHPVKVCMIVGEWTGDWTTSIAPVSCERVREGFKIAQAEETLSNQALPEHQWHIHPDIDGCASEIVIE